MLSSSMLVFPDGILGATYSRDLEVVGKEHFLWSDNLEDLKDEYSLKILFLVSLL